MCVCVCIAIHMSLCVCVCVHDYLREYNMSYGHKENPPPPFFFLDVPQLRQVGAVPVVRLPEDIMENDVRWNYHS